MAGYKADDHKSFYTPLANNPNIKENTAYNHIGKC